MTQIFVFGSNLAGRHGKGAALWARKHRGAIYGQGEGLQGTSYAIPTKDQRLKPLALDQIKQHVDKFVEFAKLHPELDFLLTRVGCGLAGYTDSQIAPMFSDVPPNCILPEEWTEFQPPEFFREL